MNRTQKIIEYDEFYRNPVKERIKIFNEISTENRAAFVKTQAERWLKFNRSRLIPEQISLIEKVIQTIAPEWYEPEKNFGDKSEVKLMIQKLETVFSREDLREMASERAKYIPSV